MKTYNYVGFFQNSEKLQKAINSFQIAGFKPTNLIIHNEANENLMICAMISDHHDYKMAENIFKFHGVKHTNEFEAKISNAEELKRLLAIHSKQQIFSAKSNKLNNHFHEGLNSEVSF